MVQGNLRRKSMQSIHLSKLKVINIELNPTEPNRIGRLETHLFLLRQTSSVAYVWLIKQLTRDSNLFPQWRGRDFFGTGQNRLIVPIFGPLNLGEGCKWRGVALSRLKAIFQTRQSTDIPRKNNLRIDLRALAPPPTLAKMIMYALLSCKIVQNWLSLTPPLIVPIRLKSIEGDELRLRLSMRRGGGGGRWPSVGVERTRKIGLLKLSKLPK